MTCFVFNALTDGSTVAIGKDELPASTNSKDFDSTECETLAVNVNGETLQLPYKRVAQFLDARNFYNAVSFSGKWLRKDGSESPYSYLMKSDGDKVLVTVSGGKHNDGGGGDDQEKDNNDDDNDDGENGSGNKSSKLSTGAVVGIVVAVVVVVIIIIVIIAVSSKKKNAVSAPPPRVTRRARGSSEYYSS